MSLPAVDDFNSGVGGSWTIVNGTFSTFSNELYSPGGGGAMYWSADAFASDHYTQGVAGSFWAAPFVVPAARMQANGDCYAVTTSGDIAKFISGSPTVIGSGGTTIVSGDVIRVSVVGTAITLLNNGVQTNSAIDATLSGGAAGVIASSSTVTLDNFEANNVGGGGGGRRFLLVHP